MTAHGGKHHFRMGFTVLIGETSGGGGGGSGGAGGGLGRTGASQAKTNENNKALKDAAKNGDEKADKTNKEDFQSTIQFGR